LRVDGATNNAVTLKFAQLLDQHLLRHAGNSFFQFGKSQGAASEELEDDHHLPTALQNAECPFDAPRGHVGGDIFEFTCG
jgi:hypothetical protein